MAFRQPFRSGLRELAEGLLRQAQVRKEQEQIKSQLELQASQQQADALRNFGNLLASGVQQAGQDYMQAKAVDEQRALEDQRRQEAEAAARGERAVNLAMNDLTQARESLATMRALGGVSDEEIATQQTLVDRLNSIVNAPLTEAADMYRETMGSNLTPAFMDVPTARERAAGRGAQELRPASGPTGSEALAGGMGTVAALRRTAGTEDQIVSTVLNNMTGFDVSDPASVVRADAAMRQAEGLPTHLRIPLEPQIAATRAALEDPEAQRLLAEAKSRGTSATRTAEQEAARSEIETERAQRDLDWFKRTRDPEMARIRQSLAAGDQQAVGTALSTGNVAGLTDTQRTALGKIVGEDVDAWAVEQRERVERLNDLEEEEAELRNQALGQSIKLGDQQYALGEVALDRQAWQRDRERYVAKQDDGRAAVQDELMIAEGIGSAVRNGDPEMIAFYMAALQNPSSPLGQQMQALGIEPDELAQRYEEAEKIRNIDRQRMENDTILQRQAIEEGRRDLAMREVLDPYQIDAMRAVYTRDQRVAEADLENLAFRNAADALSMAGQMAQTVPPEFWDDLPPQIQERFDALGVSTSYFQTISEHAEWVRGEPERERGWRMFQAMLEASPASDADQAMMLDGITEAVAMMGFDDPVQEAAFLSSAMSIWNAFDQDEAYRMLALAAQTANTAGGGGVDPVDIKRRLDGWSSVTSSIAQQRASFGNDVSLAGCARFVEGVGGISPMLTDRAPREQFSEINPSVSCGQLFDQWNDLAVQHQESINQERYWAKILSGGEVTENPANTGFTSSALQNQPTDVPGPPGPTGPQQQGDTVINPLDVSKFNTAVSLLNSGDRDAFNDLYAELADDYPESVVDAYIERLRGGQ